MGDFAAAITSLREAVRLKPNDDRSLQALGAALLRRATPADVAEAVVVMRRAVKLKPQFADALTGLGIALRESGETEESISVLREAVKLKPSMIERATTWGCRCSAIELRRGDLRIPGGDQTRRPERFRASQPRAGADAEGRRHWRGRDVSKADRVRARSRRAYYNLALAYKRKDDLDAAVETLRKLITMQPDFADAHFTLARSTSGRGNSMRRSRSWARPSG